MKNFCLLLILLCPLLGLAQEKISFLDGKEIIQLASEAATEGDFEKSLEIIDQVHPKDSIYCISLVPKSYYLLNTGRLSEAIKVADLGLAQGCGTSDLSFYINKVVGYIKSDQPEEGLAAVEEGLQVYPRSFQLWYNKGLILEKKKEIKEAVAAYQHTVLLNPAYAPPHLRLGNISYDQEHTAQAVMAFNMYLVLNPDGDGAFDVLKNLNELLRSKNPNTGNRNLEISGDDTFFEELNLLLDNRLALNEQYKVDSQLDIALTKQNHLLLSQLASHKGSEGFWSQVYVPVLKWVWNNNHFHEFINVVAFSIENKDYQKIVRNDIEGLKSFRNSLLNQWQSILEPPTFRVLPQDRELYFKYLDLRLDGIGEADGETLTGAWKFYNGDGIFTGEGTFDSEGKRTGFWRWFNGQGGIKETANYKNGFLEGENKGFFDNGRLSYVSNYKQDQLNGENLVYNKNGALLEKKYFRNGVLEGDYQSYFPVGEVLKEFDLVYRNGLIEDKAYEYYANGQIFSEMSFKAGEKNGVEIRYNRDGSLSAEMNFVGNELVGPFTTYHTNGNVGERSFYKNGLPEGDYEVFYEDGTPKSTGNLKKGNYQGVVKYFDKDGKLHYEYDYKDGEIIAYRYFDKTGEILAAENRRGGEFYYRSYAPYGQVTAEGLHDISGGKKGSWKFYSDNGILNGEGDYSEDKANGEYRAFYETGEVLSEATYKLDTLHGYYKSFFPDGQMQSQGWYMDGLQHGEWRHYFPDGNLQAKKFFHQGDFHDMQEFYGVDGKITSTLFYNFGEVLTESFYDPEGNLFEEIDRTKKGKYTIEAHHLDGQVSHRTDYVNGIKHGYYVQYDYNGNTIEEGEYLNGEQSGTWTGYYPNGEKEREVSFSRGDLHGEVLGYYENGRLELSRKYEFGQFQGVFRYLHENGEVSVLTPYLAGEENGRKEFFDPSGRLELVRFYKHGRLLGYSYLDENSEELPMIPLPNETGFIKTYFDNGKISREMEYVKGNVVGPYKSYYYSGAPKFEAVYRAGEYHGKVRDFYPNGELKSEKIYHFGALHGPARDFFENGQLKKEVNFVYDIRHGKSATFDEQGVQIKQEQYFNGNIYEAEKI